MGKCFDSSRWNSSEKKPDAGLWRFPPARRPKEGATRFDESIELSALAHAFRLGFFQSPVDFLHSADGRRAVAQFNAAQGLGADAGAIGKLNLRHASAPATADDLP